MNGKDFLGGPLPDGKGDEEQDEKNRRAQIVLGLPRRARLLYAAMKCFADEQGDECYMTMRDWAGFLEWPRSTVSYAMRWLKVADVGLATFNWDGEPEEGGPARGTPFYGVPPPWTQRHIKEGR